MPAIYSPSDFSSQARYLFELYTGPDALRLINDLPSQMPKAFETNWLEFKSGQTRVDDVKRLWSKALGSFANSGGGVLVWGVRAERDPVTGIDAVQEVVPVPDVHKLISKLKDFQPPATDPPIRGVVIQPLLLPGKEPTGFVVCLIPESESKPHRSEFGKNDVKRFNIRIGDTTQECPVPLLRQLFNPRISFRAEVEVCAEDIPLGLKGTRFAGIHGETYERVPFSLRVIIRNTGLYTIHDPLLALTFQDVTIGTFQWNNLRKEFDFEFYDNGIVLARALHPLRESERMLMFAFKPPIPSPDFGVTLYAWDLIPISATLNFDELAARPWTTKIQALV